MKDLKIAATIALGLTIGLALLNTWVIPTKDGVTFGIGEFGYHVNYNELKGLNHE